MWFLCSTTEHSRRQREEKNAMSHVSEKCWSSKTRFVSRLTPHLLRMIVQMKTNSVEREKMILRVHENIYHIKMLRFSPVICYTKEFRFQCRVYRATMTIAYHQTMCINSREEMWRRIFRPATRIYNRQSSSPHTKVSRDRRLILQTCKWDRASSGDLTCPTSTVISLTIT